MAADLSLSATALLDSTADVAGASAFDLEINHASIGDSHLRTYPKFPSSADSSGGGTTGTLAGALLPLTSIPLLNSLAGAAASIYLDFDGHFESVWGSFRNLTTPVFDQDGDAATFSGGELSTIQRVWAQVAEDFFPFNVNVTTVEPASFANGVSIRASIGGDGAWLGEGAGGVAYVDSFTNSIVNTVYVFSENLADGYARYVGEAVSHEAGHSFGLDHQSKFSSTGALLDEYNPGTSARAPIMGNSYSSTRGLWWAGKDSTNTYQDDMSILSRAANGFGYRADDHVNAVSGATPLSISGRSASGSGVIHVTGDVDYFHFDTGTGEVSFTVNVPAGVNNLDARLELRNTAGQVIASAAPSTSFGASLTTTLLAGTYRLVVRSQGYYGDVGQYTVSGTIVPVVANDIAAPTDLTATRGTEGVTLSWTDNATNETSVYVERRTNAGAWTRSAVLPADSTSYVDIGVAAGDTYDYRVQAADETSVSAFSDVASVTYAPAAPTSLTATAVSGTRVDLAWSNVAGETGYRVERLVSGGTWTQIGTTAGDVTSFQDTTTTAGKSYQYRVLASNAGGDSAYSNLASVTTPNVVNRPAAPSNLTAFINANRRVQLAWKDNSSNEQVFVVQRSSNNYSWSTLGQVPANSTGAVDLSALRSRVYYYRVLAYNAAGYSTASNSFRIATPSTLATSSTTRGSGAPGGVNTIQPFVPTAVAKPNAAAARNAAAAKAASDVMAQVFASTERWSQHVEASKQVVRQMAAPQGAREVVDWFSAVDSLFAKTTGRSWLKK